MTLYLMYFSQQPSIKMSIESWTAYTIDFIFWIAVRAVSGYMLSGSRTVLNFAAAMKHFYDGDNVKGVINFLYGVVCLVTVDVDALTAAEDLVGQGVKEAVVYVAKIIFAPTTERRTTNEVGNDLVARNLAVEEVLSGDMTTFTRVRKVAVLVTSEGVGVFIAESFSITHRSRR